MTDSRYTSKKGKDGFITHTVKKLNKRIDRVQGQKAKRKEIMGEHGMILQDMRGAKENIKAAVTPGRSVSKTKGRQAIKRVGEYRDAKKRK